MPDLPDFLRRLVMGGLAAESGPGSAVWGPVTIPDELTSYHFMACGSAGGGKSSLLRILMRSVLPAIRDPRNDARALVYDPKKEVPPELGRLGLLGHMVLLDPFDSRCSAWDVARDINDHAAADELAATMIPPSEGPNSYFYNASRKLLASAAKALMNVCGESWTLRDLMLACTNVADLAKLIERAKLSDEGALADFLTADREARSVRMTLTVENSHFYTIAAAWHRAAAAGRTFSIREWVAGNGPQVLVLGASKASRTALATINRLVVQRTQGLTLDWLDGDMESGRRSWFFLDEFPSLGSIPHLEEFLTEGRGRGICTVLGFQHISHVRKFYKETYDALVGNCLHQAYFRANDAAMAKWCAEQFGRLIQYDETGYLRRIEVNDPAATENDFLHLPPAKRSRGFKCIVKTDEDVLPNPMRFTKEPDEELGLAKPTSDPRSRRFVPWEQPLKLEPWGTPERRRLGLSDRQENAPAIGFRQEEAYELLGLEDPRFIR